MIKINNDRFNGMRQLGINTNDATAASNDIRAGETAYVKGQKIVGTLNVSAEGGSNNFLGILPMPVGYLGFTQTKYVRGEGVVTINFPEDATSVDLLIKKNSAPENILDYNQKYTFTSGGPHEITLTPNGDGNYERRYGMWAVSKNENGTQTALNYANKRVDSLLYTDGVVTESNYSGSYNSSSWMSSSYNLESKRALDYVVLTNGGSSTGAYLLNLKTKSLRKFSSSGYSIDFFEIGNNKAIATHGSNGSGCYLIDGNTDTIQTLYTDVRGINNMRSTDRFTILSSSYVTAPAIIYDKQKDTFTRINDTSYTRNIHVTPSGIFFQRSSASSSQAYLKKLNESTMTLEKVGFYNNSGELGIDRDFKFVSDSFGGFWGASYNSTWEVFRYDGENMDSTWIEAPHVGPEKNFYNYEVFSIEGDRFFIRGEKMYKFNGNDIITFATGFPSSLQLSSVAGYKQNGIYYVTTSAMSFEVSNEQAVQIASYSSLTARQQFPNKKICFSTSATNGTKVTYLIENNIVKQVSNTNLSKFIYCNNNIFAMGPSNNGAYVLQGDSFIKICDTSSKLADFIYRNGAFYILPCDRKNTSGTTEYTVYKYYIGDSTAEATDIKIKYPLGSSNYWSPANRKVYNFATGKEDTVTMGAYHKCTNGDGTGDNGYSNFCMAMHVTSTNMILLYSN